MPGRAERFRRRHQFTAGAKALGTFSHKIVGSPDYFKQHSIPQVPADLLEQHVCLHHRFPSTGKYEPWPLNENGAPIEIELPKPYVASTLQPLIACRKETGLCYVPLFTVQRQLENGNLVAVLDRFLGNSRPLKSFGPQPDTLLRRSRPL